jgi:catalase-peroxidase
MVRLAWHSAGTYRTFDGRGGGNTGNIRLAPLNSWPDNANLDKVRRYILWPIKQKYGQQISWGDLIILAGNVAIESMMGPWGSVEPLWFGGGRIDAFAPEEDVYWGNETEWLNDERHHGNNNKSDDENGDGTGLDKPLGAVQMGLIYVNPEGPGGDPDILASAKDIRETFARMGMNDEETVALIAGGHTFGKAHGAADPEKHVGPEPEGASVEKMGFGWENNFMSGKGKDTITSGLEGAWTAKPTQWDNGYFHNMFAYDWEKTKSPGGAIQWVPDVASIAKHGGDAAVRTVPDAHDASLKHLPIMFTTDLALRYDPLYGPISERFHSDLAAFTDAFKRAWYKLCHRDMGPTSRHLGPWVPKEELIWLDPVPDRDYNTVTSNDVKVLKHKIIVAVNDRSDLTISDIIKAAWASASTYRKTDHRGGANGGRIRLLPQRNWSVNDPTNLNKVITLLEEIQQEFNQRKKEMNVQVSFADLIVIAGNAAIEEAARQAGRTITIPFVPGRTDATQAQTDVDSFKYLEPVTDGFRNYDGSNSSQPEKALIDRAHLLSLTTPEMVALLGGLRVLNANTDLMQVGVLTERPGVLTNDFFINILDDDVAWSPSPNGKYFRGTRSSGRDWVASRVDLIIGSNSQLRAIAESYACADSAEYFLQDFVNAWVKVMMLDRFDLLGGDDVSSESTTVFYMSRSSSKL